MLPCAAAIDSRIRAKAFSVLLILRNAGTCSSCTAVLITEKQLGPLIKLISNGTANNEMKQIEKSLAPLSSAVHSSAPPIATA